MKFGISTLSRGLFVNREAYVEVAKTAEAAGFDFISVNDHIVVPSQLDSPYPYTQGGAWSAAEQGHCFDQLTTLAFIAGCTERLRLLTSVMVVPHRPAIATAKMLATIDVLSNGRLIVGAGAGWMSEEFRLLGAPFKERGTVTDEYLQAFKELWTKDRPSFKGAHVAFDNLVFAPKPIQRPHPPIWIGGESPAAQRRVVKVGDAWYPGNNNQQKPLDTVPRLAAAIRDLHHLAEKAGRDPRTVGVSLIAQAPFEWEERKIQDGSARRMFTGGAAAMADDAAALATAGVAHVAMRAGGDTLTDVLKRIERFGRDVIRTRA